MSESATTTTELAPRLIVRDGDVALKFYAQAFGVEPTDLMHHDGRLVNSHILVGSTLVGVVEEDGDHNRSPETVGGSSVVLSLSVPDADKAGAAFVGAGGEIVIPIGDRPYGRRDGRFKDPSGHLWILGQILS